MPRHLDEAQLALRQPIICSLLDWPVGVGFDDVYKLLRHKPTCTVVYGVETIEFRSYINVILLLHGAKK
jgi:hypothetical protein